MKKYKDLLEKKVSKDEIILGYNTKNDLKINYFDYPSIIITGETGSGKSVLLDQILVQLISKYNSYEMGIISIDTNGVELSSYVHSKYSLFSAVNNKDKSIIAISRVLKEIDRRKELFMEKEVISFDEYNKVSSSKLPLLILAIDDDKMLLNEPDLEKMISGIINNIKDYGILAFIATNNVYNKFFMNDNNLLSSVLISYDLASFEDTIYNNIEGSDNLEVGKFMCKIDDKVKIYTNYSFNDDIIEEIVN